MPAPSHPLPISYDLQPLERRVHLSASSHARGRRLAAAAAANLDVPAVVQPARHGRHHAASVRRSVAATPTIPATTTATTTTGSVTPNPLPHPDDKPIHFYGGYSASDGGEGRAELHVRKLDETGNYFGAFAFTEGDTTVSHNVLILLHQAPSTLDIRYLSTTEVLIVHGDIQTGVDTITGTFRRTNSVGTITGTFSIVQDRSQDGLP